MPLSEFSETTPRTKSGKREIKVLSRTRLLNPIADGRLAFSQVPFMDLSYDEFSFRSMMII